MRGVASAAAGALTVPVCSALSTPHPLTHTPSPPPPHPNPPTPPPTSTNPHNHALTHPPTQGTYSFPLERALMLRERAAGSYYCSAYFLAKVTVETFIQLLSPIVFTAFVYPLCGLNMYRVDKVGLRVGYWGTGVLGYWGTGVLGYWGTGVLGYCIGRGRGREGRVLFVPSPSLPPSLPP